MGLIQEIKSIENRDCLKLIIPEPFFVHSDLTVGVQLADLAANILNWGFRIAGMMIKPSRSELDPLVKILCSMRVLTQRIIPAINTEPSDIWSIALIDH